MEKVNRYKKQITSVLCTILLLFGCVCSFSFDSKAEEDIFPEGHVFYTNYPEPAKSESQGYVHVLLYNQDRDNYYMVTYFWTISSTQSEGIPTGCQGMVTLTNSTFEFNIQAQNNTTGIFYTLYHINATGDYRCVMASSSEKYMRNWEEIYQGDVRLIGWKSGGNAYIKGENFNTDFTVYYSDDGSSRLLMDILDYLDTINSQNILSSHGIWEQLVSILNETENIEDQIVGILDYLEQFETKLDSFSDDFDYLKKRADRIVALQKDTNTWLEKIWNSIQEFFNPQDDEKDVTDKFEEDNKAQSDKLNDLNEQNKTDKVDVDNASGSVDGYIDGNAISNYGELLKIFTNHEYILRCILVVLAVGLVSYVLFGKKR